MNEAIPVYAAVQNDVILDVFPTRDAAVKRVKEEQSRDFVSIVLKRKLRKFLKKNSNIALHKYSILRILETEVIE